MDMTPALRVGMGHWDAPTTAVAAAARSHPDPALGGSRSVEGCSAGGCCEPRGARKVGGRGDAWGWGEPSPGQATGDALAGGPRERIRARQGLPKRWRLRGGRGGPTGWGSPEAGGRWEGASEPAGRPCRMGSGHGLIGRAAARRGRLLAGGHKLFCFLSRSRHWLGLAGPRVVQPPRAELATGASSQTHPRLLGLSQAFAAREEVPRWPARLPG